MTDTPTSAPEPNGRPRMSRGIRIVLFLSLALNLVVVGIVAGVIFRGGPDGHPPKHVRDAVAPYTAALDRGERREIGRRIYRSLRTEGSRDALREAMRAEYAEALTLLKADSFDADAFAAVIARQTARAADRQKIGQRELVRHLSEMTADERRAYAARVAEALERFGRRARR
ncbi:periplasmic heavy metal sensor [Primorskyibacter aestuariivivens]|uniref:periplasmic heavy metal sensor n=1 Tax=Primorskyibacter aestuariivivens TaxID=1888912 RepID=UPI002301D592|nr:periplasmic heavy metal sensor [Primorskyibacter aestuariivivens]MDA7427967.1 periplasmic heavy metal sensor [Primorskyibacter aestuariivivens]